ncbi:MAG: pilus assembly protein [Pseudomonadaceae bacterium]|nr:pilus assembly protein [Pseudomonadaceae bacterium]
MKSVTGRQAQRGVAMVEFAIALPLLLLLLLGVAEFGRMLFHYNSLLQASRDAARYAAGQAWNATLGEVDLNATLQGETRNVAVYGVPSASAGFAPVVPGLSTAHVSVQQSATDDRYVQVSIAYPFQPVLGVLPNFYGDDISLSVTLNASVVMRAL